MVTQFLRKTNLYSAPSTSKLLTDLKRINDELTYGYLNTISVDILKGWAIPISPNKYKLNEEYADQFIDTYSKFATSANKIHPILIDFLQSIKGFTQRKLVKQANTETIKTASPKLLALNIEFKSLTVESDNKKKEYDAEIEKLISGTEYNLETLTRLRLEIDTTNEKIYIVMKTRINLERSILKSSVYPEIVGNMIQNIYINIQRIDASLEKANQRNAYYKQQIESHPDIPLLNDTLPSISTELNKLSDQRKELIEFIFMLKDIITKNPPPTMDVPLYNENIFDKLKGGYKFTKN
jgi:hypothetical protein